MSAKYKLIILPEAQKDIREIVLYVARELAAPQAALDLQDAFHDGMKNLVKMPERIKSRPAAICCQGPASYGSWL